MFRLISPIGIQRDTLDGQAKACWGVIQLGYTRIMLRKFWFKDQEARVVFWLRLWAPMQVDTLRGPSPEFVEKEANHRIQVNLTIYEITISGEVEITGITRGPIVGRPWTRPLRDFSPSMSHDFRAWMGSFS